MVRPFYLIVIIFTLHACSHSRENPTSTQTTLPYETIALTSTASFQDTDENWQTAGNVYANHTEDRHLEKYDGTGILVNLPSEEHKGNLFSTFEHADVELELDFMMPKGSNSGIYLQSRYEIQLFDSWGVEPPKHSDCGGIYQRWDESRPEGEKGYEGHPPRINAAKAPGLWQHLFIRFKAPDFDENGRKISNAKFEEVILNGVTIHENVEVTGPTRAAAFEDEAPLAPLMIQGDHGPVAFKNIRYKRYGDQQATLNNIQYQIFEGEFASPDTITALTPQKEGETDSISYLVNREFEKYALRFTGTLDVPTSGDYLFKAQTSGGNMLTIDGKPVINYAYSDILEDVDYGTVSLDEGKHEFEFVYIKEIRPWRKGMGLYYEGPEIPMQPLHTMASLPPPQSPEPIIVQANGYPELQRGFLMHEQQKRTHCITVGTPENTHYAYDLSQGALLSAWSGSFIDATDMWHRRGEAQLIQPLGNVVTFFDQPSFAILTSEEMSWPDTISLEQPSYYQGYALDSMGLPTFNYQLKSTRIHDYLYPEKDGERALHRTIHFVGDDNNLYCRIAEGTEIEKLPNGSYAIDDKNYYLEIEETDELIIRNVGNKKELLFPVNTAGGEAVVKYSLIW